MRRWENRIGKFDYRDNELATNWFIIPPIIVALPLSLGPKFVNMAMKTTTKSSQRSRERPRGLEVLVLILAILSITIYALADPINCDLSAYQAQPGLTATVADETLTVVWKGDSSSEVRIRFENSAGHSHPP